MEQAPLQQRYQQLDWRQQIGNLASTLARISSRSVSPTYDDLVSSLLREAALFIEWSAPYVPEVLLLDLAPLQREMLLWRRLWPQDALRPLLSVQARHISDRLLRSIT
ncbi:MAG: hypothetical protein JW953_13620 [Anaerolineae bacterium]|nr:hypothetical protein [Anaerolineae bacterium]